MHGSRPPGLRPFHYGAVSAGQLHRRRLLYRAYVLDQSLSLRLFKPPLLTEGLVVGIPGDNSVDHHGVIALPEGRSLNYLQQQLLLAKIQNKVNDDLRSPLSSDKGSQHLLEATSKLLEDLQRWADGLPVSTRPPNLIENLSIGHTMQITSLHHSYFQTLIAIHSAIFCHIPYFSDPAIRRRTVEVVNECASAARNILYLSMHTKQSRPLTWNICHDLGWSIDGLLLSIVLNRQTPGAKQDVEMLKELLLSFETKKPQHDSKVIHEVLAIMYNSAVEALSHTSRVQDQIDFA